MSPRDTGAFGFCCLAAILLSLVVNVIGIPAVNGVLDYFCGAPSNCLWVFAEDFGCQDMSSRNRCGTIWEDMFMLPWICWGVGKRKSLSGCPYSGILLAVGQSVCDGGCC